MTASRGEERGRCPSDFYAALGFALSGVVLVQPFDALKYLRGIWMGTAGQPANTQVGSCALARTICDSRCPSILSVKIILVTT
jgi:hypothetical protein